MNTKMLYEPYCNLELSVRAHRILGQAKCVTVYDVCKLTEPQILKFRDCGHTTLGHIKERVADAGFWLGMKSPKGFLDEALELEIKAAAYLERAKTLRGIGTSCLALETHGPMCQGLPEVIA